jgi:hypothetical protein
MWRRKAFWLSVFQMSGCRGWEFDTTRELSEGFWASIFHEEGVGGVMRHTASGKAGLFWSGAAGQAGASAGGSAIPRHRASQASHQFNQLGATSTRAIIRRAC